MTFTNSQQSLLIVGPSGAGKHLFATQRLVNSLAEGNSAVVFECSHAYAPLAKSLGGTVVTIDASHNCTVERFGSMPLTVYDLSTLGAPLAVNSLPNLPTRGGATYVLVDDLADVNRCMPDLWLWLKERLDFNFTFCGVLQSLGHTGVEKLPLGIPVQYIEKFELASSDTLHPGQLVRHQDGGIYRYHSTALHTDDQTELVIYEHVWPFDAGQLWARPAHEWPSRFTPITTKELRDAQRQDRVTAQAAVTNAKVARRAAEMRLKTRQQKAESARKALLETDFNRSVVVPAGSGMTFNAADTQ